MHLTHTEVLKAVMIAEPWLIALPNSVAIINACYTVHRHVFSPQLFALGGS